MRILTGAIIKMFIESRFLFSSAKSAKEILIFIRFIFLCFFAHLFSVVGLSN